MKTALVTGSTRGIGRAIAERLAQAGYRVVINGRNAETVQQVCAQIGDLALPLVLDMGDEAGVITALNGLPELDLVVANVGSGKTLVADPFSTSDFKRLFDLNFFTAASVCLLAAQRMIRSKKGHIVLISSIAGGEEIGAPLAYTTAKTALLGFSKSLSRRVGTDNVRVNVVSPGNILFDGGTWDQKLKDSGDKVLHYIADNVPLNRFGTPQEMAEVVLFLENSPFITGANIVADGGQTRKIT